MLLQDSEKITEKYKKCKQVLCRLRKQNKNGNSFPGGFSTNIIPYVDLTSYGSVSKTVNSIIKALGR